ncbi:hypothetical protein BON30_46750 [Cystobacter ferrugineus]|uniref:Uncharacterized protein n=2 Tax=Cystobacter ferrugineus TaxID=83449 RepID=A0A1L9AUZ5_9BACT|nr:hypothetical protein BON30_46750 [Cystobacter ferrugineus]
MNEWMGSGAFIHAEWMRPLPVFQGDTMSDSRTGMKSSLEEVLRYRNDAVVHRFIKTWELSFEEAQELFRETLKWLWLSAYSITHQTEVRQLAISQSLLLLDEMWHTFILFTRDYHEFCDRYFGLYIHHRPTVKEEEAARLADYERDPAQYVAQQKALFRAQYALIYDVLGEETLNKWYSTYLEQYSDLFMKRIWRWSFSPHDTQDRNQLRLDTPRASTG